MISLIVCLGLVTLPAFGNSFIKSRGQTVYAPASHNCYFGDPCMLSVNTRLSIRNVDLNHAITVTEINFHGPDGDLVTELLTEPLELQPLASATFAVRESDESPYWAVFMEGKPSFIVKWTAELRVHPPMIASAHAILNWVSSPSQQNPNPFSFEGLTVTPATVLRERWRHR